MCLSVSKANDKERKKGGEPTCSQEPIDRLERPVLQRIHPLVRPRTHHRVLPADLVAGDRMVRGELGRVRDHVQIGKRRLDHDHVGPFVDVSGLSSKNAQRV